MARYRKFKMFKAYPGNGYQHMRMRRTLEKLRGLGIFNRRTGERELSARRKAYGIANSIAFNRSYNYPTNNRRTLSLSKRSFTDQVSQLCGSKYFIDQYRGAVKNMYGTVRKVRNNWHSDIDTLALQARNILRKEEEERARPITEYFESLRGDRSRLIQPSVSESASQTPNYVTPKKETSV